MQSIRHIMVFEEKSEDGKLDCIKAKKLGDVRNKMKLGRKLSYDEKAFLKIYSSDLYEKAKKIEEERDEFRRALTNCKTKEEARRTQIKKSMELQMEQKNEDDLEFITTRMMRMMGILDEFSNFSKSKDAL
jgi:recombinational DNA repair ATPase RecF